MCYHFFHLPITGPRITTLRVASLLEFPARYHVVPTQEIAVIRAVQGSNERELTALRWGLIPSWVQSPADMSVMLANARAETLSTKPSFKQAYLHRRCLILADGFFEWKRHLTNKQPYCIRPVERQLITFAGIWERWERGDRKIESCSIVTTAANSVVSSLHDRMPAILPEKHHDQWLDTNKSKPDKLAKLLQPSDLPLEMYPVRPLRGKKTAQSAGTIEPITLPPIQRSMFDDI